MNEYIFISLLAYSIFWFLNYSELTKFVREKYFKTSSKDGALESTFFGRLLTCAYCLGFHIGWIFMYFVFDNGFLFALCGGFVVAIFSYFLKLFEEWLIHNSI